jgi:hypothetical protein
VNKFPLKLRNGTKGTVSDLKVTAYGKGVTEGFARPATGTAHGNAPQINAGYFAGLFGAEESSFAPFFTAATIFVSASFRSELT